MSVYKFQNCMLNTVERRVIGGGVYLNLTPRTFDVLRVLVERSGKIVSKDDMLGEVWNGEFVEESNLAVHICRLRILLRSAGPKRFIETVYGNGYRLVCSARVIDDIDWHEDLFSNREINGSHLAAARPEPMIRRIRIANNVVVRIEIENHSQ